MIKCLPPVVEKAPWPFSCDAFFLFTWSKQKRLGMNRVRRRERERGLAPRFTSNIEAPYSFLLCAPSIEEVWVSDQETWSRTGREIAYQSRRDHSGRRKLKLSLKIEVACDKWRRDLWDRKALWGSINWSLERRCLNGAIRGENFLEVIEDKVGNYDTHWLQIFKCKTSDHRRNYTRLA